MIRMPGAMVAAWGWSLWPFLVGLVASVVLGWRHRGSRDPAGRALVGIAAGSVASLAWALMVFNGWADAMVAVPLAAVGMGGLVTAAGRALSARWTTPLAAAYVLVVSTTAGLTAWTTSPDVLDPMREEVSAVLAAAGPDATVQSIGGPQPLALAGLRNPSRHQMFLQGLDDYVDQTEPGGLAGLAADLEERRPTFVTLDYLDRYDWIDPVLERDYRQVGTTAGCIWFADRRLGEDRLAELTRILAGAP